MCQAVVRRLFNPSERCHVRKLARLLAQALIEKIARTRPSGFDPPRTVAERMLVSQPARLPGPGTCTWRYEVDSLYNNTSSAREWTTSSPPSEPTLLCSLRSRSPRGCKVASTSGGGIPPLDHCNPATLEKR